MVTHSENSGKLVLSPLTSLCPQDPQVSSLLHPRAPPTRDRYPSQSISSEILSKMSSSFIIRKLDPLSVPGDKTIQKPGKRFVPEHHERGKFLNGASQVLPVSLSETRRQTYNGGSLSPAQPFIDWRPQSK